MPRVLTLGLLTLVALVTGCSTLRFGYEQLPRLASWQVDGYLDLNRAQGRELDAALAELHAWHRREELPRVREVLARADALWGEGVARGSVSADQLDAIEREAAVSLNRLLARAEPLARPLLAGLQPAQWKHLQTRQRERLDEWMEEEGDAEARGDRFVENLERWLGDLERPLRRLAREEAKRWPVQDRAVLREILEARQQRIVEALRAVAAGRSEQGLTQLTAVNAEPVDPVLKEAMRVSVLRVLNATTPTQREQARARWVRWREDLQHLETLQTARADS